MGWRDHTEKQSAAISGKGGNGGDEQNGRGEHFLHFLHIHPQRQKQTACPGHPLPPFTDKVISQLRAKYPDWLDLFKAFYQWCDQQTDNGICAECLIRLDDQLEQFWAGEHLKGSEQ